MKMEKKKIISSIFKTVMLFISIQALFLLAVLVIYFTDFSLLMQIAIVIFIAITMILITKNTWNELLNSLYAMMAAFVLFLLTVHIVLFIEHASSNGLLLAIVGHSLAWFYIGWKWSIRFFVIAAILAIFVLLFILVRLKSDKKSKKIKYPFSLWTISSRMRMESLSVYIAV